MRLHKQNLLDEASCRLAFAGFLPGTAEYLARRWGLNIPNSTNDGRRFLKHPWFATTIEALIPLLPAQCPPAVRRRMIFVEHEPLSRARVPRRTDRFRPNDAFALCVASLQGYEDGTATEIS